MAEIDLQVFEGEPYPNERVLVLCSNEQRPAVREALARTAKRWLRAGADGEEHGEADPYWRWCESPGTAPPGVSEDELHAPKYVSDPIDVPDGIRIYADCQSSVSSVLADLLRRILREELDAAGLSDLHAVPYGSD